MGNMSAKRMAGLSIMWGPVITLICYFAQQLVILAGVDWSDAAANKDAWVAGGSLTVITSLIIPIALFMLVYGVFHILDEMRDGGNGDALARYAKPMMLIALAGYTYANGFPIIVVNNPDMGIDAIYAQWSIFSMSGILFTLAFLITFSAMGSRDEYKGTFNTVAIWVAVLAVACSIIGFVNSGLGGTMTQIVGVTYLVHTVYAIRLGRGMLAGE